VSWWRRLLSGPPPPAGFDAPLDAEERLLGSAPVTGGGHLVASTLGLWVPDGAGHRRIGWHLVSKARWDGRAMTVVEADVVGRLESDPPGPPDLSGAVVIADRDPRRFPLPQPGPVPELVHARVTRSVLHSEHAESGDLVVRRRVPGRDGVQTQIRRTGT